jgi:hypothetical protein
MEQIKEQFKKVIEYSQRIPDPQVDELFERWLDAKQWFINAFGGKLIYEHPEKISFHLSESHKDKRILEFEEHIASIYQNDKLLLIKAGVMLNQEEEMNEDTMIKKQFSTGLKINSNIFSSNILGEERKQLTILEEGSNYKKEST